MATQDISITFTDGLVITEFLTERNLLSDPDIIVCEAEISIIPYIVYVTVFDTTVSQRGAFTQPAHNETLNDTIN